MRLESPIGLGATFVLIACGSRSSVDASAARDTDARVDSGGESGPAGNAVPSGAGGDLAPEGVGGSLAMGGAGGSAAMGGAAGSNEVGHAGTNDGGDTEVVPPRCGNGSVEMGEACDDGNTTSGDGCSEKCTVDPGFVCTGDASTCTHPSCVGLPKTCGPKGNGDCCASLLVPGIASPTFYRSFDGVTSGYKSMANPAQVSDFRLDQYEITVGRFRRFVAAYSQTMIAKGAGANPNNPSDPGWSADWNASLDTNATTLVAALNCYPPQGTWTDEVGPAATENRPITCIDWYEAEAFCIWDGGRLPTEAEWNYAASGGTEQRQYPWGNAPPDCSYANYSGRGVEMDSCVGQLGVGMTNPVGSESPKGDGKFGQADLAGNISEWVQDWFAMPDANTTPYLNPCKDCADLRVDHHRVIRGGSLFDGAPLQLTSFRTNGAPSDHDLGLGGRCARAR